MNDTIKLTIEMPAGLATALTALLESLKVVAVETKGNNFNCSVVGVGSVVDEDREVVPLPESADEVVRFCIDNQLVVDGNKFYDYYNKRNWINTKGKQVDDWKALILMWDEEDRRKYPDRRQQKTKQQIKDDAERLKRKLGIDEVNDNDTDYPG